MVKQRHLDQREYIEKVFNFLAKEYIINPLYSSKEVFIWKIICEVHPENRAIILLDMNEKPLFVFLDKEDPADFDCFSELIDKLIKIV
jgi:hypothetical protein